MLGSFKASCWPSSPIISHLWPTIPLHLCMVQAALLCKPEPMKNVLSKFARAQCFDAIFTESGKELGCLKSLEEHTIVESSCQMLCALKRGWCLSKCCMTGGHMVARVLVTGLSPRSYWIIEFLGVLHALHSLHGFCTCTPSSFNSPKTCMFRLTEQLPQCVSVRANGSCELYNGRCSQHLQLIYKRKEAAQSALHRKKTTNK